MENLRANLIGSGGLSQFEADVSGCLFPYQDSVPPPRFTSPQTLTQAYRRELHKFDTQRVIVAWDALMSKQQGVLESLGVPGMFVSHLTSDTEARVHHCLPISLPPLT